MATERPAEYTVHNPLFNPCDVAGTAVNCDKHGHCFHPGTAVCSRVCCRCGVYESQSFKILNTSTWVFNGTRLVRTE